MSELKHPPIDLGLQRDMSQQRWLAEETFSLIQNFGYADTTTIDKTAFTYGATPPVELTSTTSDDICLRVVTTPVMAVSGKQPWVSSSSYYVMDLQHGVYTGKEDDDYDPKDEDYNWQSYVRIIIDVDNNEEPVCVIDGTTFKEVSEADLVQVNFVVNSMRQEYTGMAFEDELTEAAKDNGDAQNIQLGKFVAFNSADFYDVAACDTCGSENQACAHNPATLN